MASIINRPNKHRWIQYTDSDGKRQTLRLGQVTKKNAEEVCRRVERLIAAKTSGDSLDASTAGWLATLEGSIRDRMVTLGLCEAPRQRRTLEAWIDEFRKLNPQWKPSSVENYEAATGPLLEFFKADRIIDTIKPHEADDFRKWLLTERFNRQTGGKGHADDTVRRRCGRAKALWKEAIRRRYAIENPFADIVTHTRGNKARQHFVTADVAYDCIEAAPCLDWRTIIALCRFGALRCPTEVVNLAWTDVNLPEGFMVLRQPKVEHHEGGGVRVCPIFPELSPYLEAAWDAAPEGAVHVINRYRRHDQNLGTTFKKIVERAGHKPWPKLLQNLRASRETELLARFPAKDVTEWCGNSIAVAMDHYAMATKATFKAAMETRSIFETPNAQTPGEGAAKGEAVNSQTGDSESQNPKQSAAATRRPQKKKPAKSGLNGESGLVGATCDTDHQLPRQDSNLRQGG